MHNTLSPVCTNVLFNNTNNSQKMILPFRSNIASIYVFAFDRITQFSQINNRHLKMKSLPRFSKYFRWVVLS